MILTTEQKRAYIESGWAKCPVCKSENISGGHIDIEANQAWQNVSCADCGAEWRDVYQLAFVETDDETGNPEPEVDDSVKCCPDCEKPNQCGELCPSCQREREELGQE